MYFAKVFASCLLFAALVGSGYANPSARLTGGQEVDSLRQFPFYVYIKVLPTEKKCGGSILNSRWILTSSNCVDGNDRLELSFGRKNENNPSAAYFTISVNKDQVYPYPTTFDDLALVKLPLTLDLTTDSIKEVALSTDSISLLSGKFAVLAGFKEDTADDDNLQYGMFNVLSQSTCKASVSEFNEYNEICAKGWGADVSCESDYGSGLIVGWPNNNKLIGIYSTISGPCDVAVPGVYTYINKYAAWINAMINN